MAQRLTRRQREHVGAALAAIDRATGYLMRPTTVVAMRKAAATTTLDYRRESDGAALCEVAKDYGSDLCALATARQRIQNLLDEELAAAPPSSR